MILSTSCLPHWYKIPPSSCGTWTLTSIQLCQCINWIVHHNSNMKNIEFSMNIIKSTIIAFTTILQGNQQTLEKDMSYLSLNLRIQLPHCMHAYANANNNAFCIHCIHCNNKNSTYSNICCCNKKPFQDCAQFIKSCLPLLPFTPTTFPSLVMPVARSLMCFVMANSQMIHIDKQTQRSVPSLSICFVVTPTIWQNKERESKVLQFHGIWFLFSLLLLYLV